MSQSPRSPFEDSRAISCKSGCNRTLISNGLREARHTTFAWSRLYSPSGSVIVQLAAIRLGFGDAQVDSWSSGGIAGPVDPETGRIGIVWTMPEFGGKVMDVHPDTGSHLTGTIVPCWDEVKAAAITMARLTPGQVVGWDVVISSDGPRIVEGNFDWSLALVQSGTQGFLGGPVAETWRLLGADLPDGSFSWRWRHRRRPVAAAVRRLLRSSSADDSTHASSGNLRSAAHKKSQLLHRIDQRSARKDGTG